MLAIIQAELLTEMYLCSDNTSYFSKQLGACIYCATGHVFFNGSCYAECIAGNYLALGGACKPCTGCNTSLKFAACANPHEYVLETDGDIKCVQYPKYDGLLHFNSMTTCLAGEAFSTALNKCIQTGETISQLCISGDVYACNYLYFECILDNTKCTAYDSLATELKMPRNLDLQTYAETNFTAKIGPSGTSANEPNAELQDAYTGELYLILYDKHAQQLYNDKFFEGALSLCYIFRGIENTRTTYYSANSLNINDTSFSSFANATSYQFLTRPVTFSRVVEAGTRFGEECDLPGRQIYDFIRENSLFAAIYSRDEHGDYHIAPIINSSKQIHFKEKNNIPAALDYTSESIFPLFYALDSSGNYSLATRINIDFQIDHTTETTRLPILRVQLMNLTAPLFSLNYIKDNNYQTGYFRTITGQGKNNNRPHAILHINWFSARPQQYTVLIVTSVCMGLLGIVYGYFAAYKYAGSAGHFITTKIVHKFAASGNLRTAEEVQKRDFMPIFIFSSYIIGFLGLGFIFYGIFYALSFMERPTSYIRFIAAEEDIYIYTSVGVLLAFAFYIFRSYLESQKMVLFFEHDNSGDPHAIAWRCALCLNAFDKVYRSSPISNGITIILMLTTLFAADLLYMGNGSRNWGFSPYYQDSFAESLSITMIYVAISLFQALLNYAVYSFFPSVFLKFQHLLPAFGLSALIFDTPKSGLLINGKDGILDITGTYDYTIGDLMTYVMQLSAKHLYTPKFGENSSQILRCFFGEQNMLFLVYSEMHKIIELQNFAKRNRDHAFAHKLFGFLDYDVQYESNENSILLQAIYRYQFAVLESAMGSNAQNMYYIKQVGILQQFNDFGEWQPNNDIFIRYQRTTPAIDYLYENPLYKSLFGYRLWFYEVSICAGGMLILDYYLHNWAIAIFVPLTIVYAIKYVTNRLVSYRNGLINGLSKDWVGLF